jgi:hypothetical protein
MWTSREPRRSPEHPSAIGRTTAWLGSHGFVNLDLTLRGGKKLNGHLRDSFLEAIELSERSAGRWAN